MRCGCSQCSAYMVQLENGLKSGCICPECGNFCDYCMGTQSHPKTKEAIAAMYSGIEPYTQSENLRNDTAATPDTGFDWRRIL